jgi:hypothetical protein
MGVTSPTKSLARFGIAMVFLAAGVGCGASTAPATRYALSLVMDRTQDYQCFPNNGDLYCTTWRDATGTTPATLTVGGSATLTVNGVGYTSTSFSEGSPSTFSVPNACPFYILAVTISGKSVTGSWDFRRDCHTAHSVGHVTSP